MDKKQRRKTSLDPAPTPANPKGTKPQKVQLSCDPALLRLSCILGRWLPVAWAAPPALGIARLACWALGLKVQAWGVSVLDSSKQGLRFWILALILALGSSVEARHALRWSPAQKEAQVQQPAVRHPWSYSKDPRMALMKTSRRVLSGS